MKYCFGVDVGGTSIKIGLFTVEGNILDKWEIKTRRENKGEAILPERFVCYNRQKSKKGSLAQTKSRVSELASRLLLQGMVL